MSVSNGGTGEPRNRERRRETNAWLLIGAVSGTVALLVLGLGPLSEWQWDTLGQVGDFFGGVFTGLAFAGLIITILIQRRELRNAEKEQAAQLELSVMATLVDIYSSRIHVMEQGQLRSRLWTAKNVVINWGKESGEPRDDEEALDMGMESNQYKEYRNKVFHFRNKDGTYTNDPDPLFRSSFEEWIRAHRKLAYFIAKLEKQFPGNQSIGS